MELDGLKEHLEYREAYINIECPSIGVDRWLKALSGPLNVVDDSRLLGRVV
jgi:hypothetical protein